MERRLQVEVWSDVVCPWCYIGKRRFERAIDQVADEIEVEVIYRPFQLDPRAPRGAPTPVLDVYAAKFGGPERARAIIDHVSGIAAAEGVDFRLDAAWRANTFDAHRLLWFTEHLDSPVSQAAMKERLLRAYFIDGLDVGDRDVLVACAADVGVEREVAEDLLDGEMGVAEVSAMLARAHELGITGVPAYVFEGGWQVPGAQDTDVFVQVLRRLAAR